MIITKEIENQVSSFMDTYWSTYLKGDIKTWATFLTDDYKNIGGTEEEIWNNKKEILEYTHSIIDQMVGVAELRNKKTEVFPMDPFILVHEFMDMYIKIENDWSFYGKFRLSSIIQKNEAGYQVIHQHGSYPDAKTEQGEAFAFDKISTENRELKDAIKRRTAELENKTRELEIEAALEKVRSAALAMKELADMANVCHIISDQLELLNVKEIRNVQTAIFYEDKGTYFNYEYYTKHNKALITEVDYKNHEVQTTFAQQMLTGAEELFTIFIKDKELKDWYAYQKTTNQFADGYLENAEILCYYWFSLGPVALGMSTYVLLTEDEINLFKRFRNVFELAYRRFLDIEKAIAQAKEARLETALERVRSVAMAMRMADELPGICETLYKELLSLGFTELRNSMINIYNDEQATFVNYDYSDEIGKSINHLHYNIHPVIEKQIKQLRSADDAFSESVFEGKDLEDMKNFRTEIGEKNDPRINDSSALYYYFYSIGTGSIGISSFNALTAEKLAVLKRFRNVFSLSYQRYIDISLAEAQAREAQIELAMERVRARTMAMQKSEELSETAYVLFQQFKELGESPHQITIGIINEAEGFVQFNITGGDGSGAQIKNSYKFKIDEPALIKKLVKPWKEDKKSTVIELAGKDLTDWVAHRNLISGMIDNTDYTNARRYVAAGYFAKGLISISTILPTAEETTLLLERFAQVFDQTYTRFLDLQKAEAQTREAEIQLALERVRARSLAMHHSSELQDIVNIVAQQLYHIGIDINGGVFITINDEVDENLPLWASSGAADYVQKVVVPFFDRPIFTELRAAIKKRNNFFANEYSKEEKDELFDHLSRYAPWSSSSEERKKELLSRKGGLTRSAAISQYTSIAITNHNGKKFSEEEHEILKRFGNVFEQSYARFLDLQKAEAQAKEAQIEAALERVRSRSMGMQKSEELKEVIKIVYQQLIHVKINLDHAGFVVDYTPGGDWHFWIADEQDIPGKISHPYFDSVWANQFDQAKEKEEDFFATHLNFEEKNKFYNKLLSYVPGLPEATKDFYLRCPALAASTVLLENVGLYIENFAGTPYTDEENATLIRFGNVFQQTYTRFLDLQKAEAQAREARIEAALERTRTQSMIMQHSNELDDTLRVFHEQVLLLGIPSAFSFLWLPDEKNDRHIFWAAWREVKNGSTVFESKAINYPLDRNEPATAQCLIDWKSNEAVYSYQVPAPEVENYFAVWKELIDGVEHLKPEYFSGGLHYVEAFMKYGCFGVMVVNDLTEDEKKILNRFSKEFERTYTRFLDLQKAEAQAREAEIELALERVRARTMAMQHSEELQDTSLILFEQLKELGEPAEQCTIGIIKESEGVVEISATLHGNKMRQTFRHKLDEPFVMTKMFKSWKDQQRTLVLEIKGEELQKYNQYRNELVGKETFPVKLLPGDRWIIHIAYFSKGMLALSTNEPRPAESLQLLERFAIVFEQTYIRFLDLQKAEANAREAKIESALEKVRSRTMAMQKSTDLAETSALLFAQLNELVPELWTCGFVLCDKNKTTDEWWLSGGSGFMPDLILPNIGDSLHNNIYEAWLNGESYYEEVIEGEPLQQHYDWLMTIPSAIAAFDAQAKAGIKQPTWQQLSCAYFSKGYLVVITEKPCREAQIFKRFAQVFEQTYTRFLDLQKAEAQAREAQIEAALERVRSRTLAMHKSVELAETAAVLFQQLILLGIEPTRLYITIIKDEAANAEFWITDEDGSKVSAAFETNMNSHATFKKMYNGWKEKNKTLVIDMKGDELQEYFKYLASIHVPFKGGLSQTRRLQYIAYFNKGFIGMASPDEQPKETIQLLERFSAVFNLTFTRFNDLKIAEAHALQAEEDLVKLQTEKHRAEEALAELQVTQKQLIQSEKMASLGELTAGIAHEIQNPLNFVNNFSEVSKELLDEMYAEIDKGDMEEAKAIAIDIKQNLEKINHHGKRADGIVKGMLQHSRSSSGHKEPTDINALADEYLRLAYHGLRAKDKSFNATMKTDYDENLGNINIIPQDIGRVILNLITNAFYAVNEKTLSAFSTPEAVKYEPTVSIITKKVGDIVEIKVKDNGYGIPTKVLDKIFQPFFTTKPAGQGTGLGLSLSYDIIKAHGGILNVETKEGEGSEFIIRLPMA